MTVTSLGLTGTEGASLVGSAWDIAGQDASRAFAVVGGLARFSTGIGSPYGYRVAVRSTVVKTGGEFRHRYRVVDQGEAKAALGAFSSGYLANYMSGSSQGYALEMNLYIGEVKLLRVTGEVGTQLGATLPGSLTKFAPGTEWNTAFRMTATGLHVWFWKQGDARPTEPTWTTTDTTYQSGRLTFGLGAGAKTNAQDHGVALLAEHDDLVASNAAPTANAGADQAVTTGAAVTLTGAASTDTDGTVASYSWSLTSKPSGSAAALSGTGATRTFTADLAGTYTASLIVTDDDGATSSADTVSVLASAPGPVEGVNLLPNPGAEVNASGWSIGGGTVERVTSPVRTGAGAFRCTAVGGGNMNLIAAGITNASGQKFAVGQTVTVSGYVRAGSTSRQATLKIDWGSPSGYMSTSNVAADVTSVSGGWTFLTGEVVVPAGATVLSAYGQIIAPAAGEVHLWDDMRVTTGAGALPTIRVGADPVSGAVVPSEVVWPDTIPLYAEGTNYSSVAWTIDSKPAGSSAVITNPTSPAATFEPDKADDAVPYVFRVTATGPGGSAFATVQVTVSAQFWTLTADGVRPLAWMRRTS